MKSEHDYRRFWEQLSARSKQRGFSLFEGIESCKDGYLLSIIGEKKNPRNSIGYEYALLVHNARAQLRINYEDADKNKRIYDALESNREQIENDFGNALCWSRDGLRNKECKYSLISYVVVKKGFKDKEQWTSTQEKMIDSMKKLESALSKHMDRSSFT